MPDLRGTRTHESLTAAFARESQANRRYVWFAQQADVEGHPEAAALFRSIADGETGHALDLLEFLAETGDPATGEPIGSTDENLEAAIAGEIHDATESYPRSARIARDEGFDQIADWFETLAGAEQSHADRFTQGLEALG